MAITGTLKADFSEFVSESKKAEASLKNMEGGAKKVDDALNQVTAGAPQRIGTLRTSFTQVDQVLAASGVNIGKYARGLVEIEEMAGKTVTELGLLSSAASVFGAAMAGWNFGRAIAGFFDLDTKIGNATAKLLGWGDVAAEEAGAGADVLAIASQRAGRQITDMSEAIVVNTKFVQDNQAALQAEAEAAANAVRPQSDLMRAWNDSARAANAVSEASTIWGDGIPPVTEKEKSLLEVLDEILAIQEPIQSGLKFTTETVGELGDESEDTAKKVRNLAGEMEDLEAFKKRQLAGSSTTIAPLTQSGLLQAVFDSPTARMAGGGEKGLRARLAELERLEGTYAPKDNLSYFAMIKDQILLAQLRMYFAGKDRVPGFAGGVTNFSGGLARVHEGELLVNMPAGTDVIPRGGGGGRVYNINLSGMVGDRAGLARMVKQVLVNGERAAGKRLTPAGAVG